MEWSPRNLGIIIVGFILTCIVFVMFPYSLYKGAKEHKRRTESKQKNLWIPDILFPYLPILIVLIVKALKVEITSTLFWYCLEASSISTYSSSIFTGAL